MPKVKTLHQDPPQLKKIGRGFTQCTKFIWENVWELFRRVEGMPTLMGKRDDITMTSCQQNPNFTFPKMGRPKMTKPVGNGKYDPKKG